MDSLEPGADRSLRSRARGAARGASTAASGPSLGGRRGLGTHGGLDRASASRRAELARLLRLGRDQVHLLPGSTPGGRASREDRRARNPGRGSSASATISFHGPSRTARFTVVVEDGIARRSGAIEEAPSVDASGRRDTRQPEQRGRTPRTPSTGRSSRAGRAPANPAGGFSTSGMRPSPRAGRCRGRSGRAPGTPRRGRR